MNVNVIIVQKLVGRGRRKERDTNNAPVRAVIAVLAQQYANNQHFIVVRLGITALQQMEHLDAVHVRRQGHRRQVLLLYPVVIFQEIRHIQTQLANMHLIAIVRIMVKIVAEAAVRLHKTYALLDSAMKCLYNDRKVNKFILFGVGI